MHYFKNRLAWHISFALLVPMIAPAAAAPITAAQQKKAELNLLLLEVRIEPHTLSDAITAYQYGKDVFLPLGEISKLLTIAIRTQPEERRATGYVLNEEQAFNLDLAQSSVTIGGNTEAFDPNLVTVRPDDIYVASKLIARWLPADFDIDLSSLLLRVRPREKLPLQLRLEREGRSRRTGARHAYEDPGYQRHDSPYRLLGVPFIDQTLGVDVRRAIGSSQVDAGYTAYLTGDLLGMESSLYVNSTKQKLSPDLRFTLGRHDPDAGLLGPLRARSLVFGSVPVPGVANIAVTSPTGNGLTVSNRPLTQPTSFDRHSLQGDLPPGWDVELYFNDALVGFQQSRADGKFSFEDQPLIYGPNEFRLVFHGPLGQLRVERQSFLLEQSVTVPGQFYYNFTEHRDQDGQARSVAQFDVGLNRNFSVTGGLVRLPVAGQEQRYVNLGLRSLWQSFMVTGDFVKSHKGGALAEMALRTRVGGVSIGVSRARLDNFTSDIYAPSNDPVRMRDKIRLDGVIPLDFLPRLPLTLEAKRDRLQSGTDNIEVAGRISMYPYGTAVSNALRWQSLGGARSGNGILQVSRRIAGVGVNGQLTYALKPDIKMDTVAIAADKALAAGYILNLGLARSYLQRETLYTVGLNKSLGAYGLGVSARYSSKGDIAVGAQLFIAMGQEPRESRWMVDAQPIAKSGGASVRVFVDKNLNGIMDADEEPVKDARFTVNGGANQSRTDEKGVAYLANLPVKQNVDVALDTASLEDPQWSSRMKGVRLVPRPGKVVELDFPVIMTGEIDGTVYFVEKDEKRGIGDVLIELVDSKRKVIAQTKTASDGYYIVPAVPPGAYLLRISREQLKRLKMTDTGSHMLTMTSDGTFLNGLDFSLIRPW
ncbi:collagen binding domain-containing protein [Lacisediminimonas sp.]|uniref:MSCRAMM family protein n=1 Tax=Lacisediminimonas sp. TaxID=3060582 RepID=UPI002723CE22|nr:carboxypeptidase-like regulatory domain-containing protein [Lacisediminimonas sp.]MDO8301290.1 carboxypeptidase-like regulatory domain-containing protein [Lacisediminimonas sp.]